MGMLCPAIVSFISLRVIELVGIELHPAVWGKMTVYYSISQAFGAYIMSYLLHRGATYTECFVIASIAFLLGFIAVVFARNSQLDQLMQTK